MRTLQLRRQMFSRSLRSLPGVTRLRVGARAAVALAFVAQGLFAQPGWASGTAPILFSEVDEGRFPSGWRTHGSEGRAGYEVRREGARVYLHAESNGDAHPIGREIDPNPRRLPWLRILWRAMELPRGADERVKKTSDSGLGVYVAFDGLGFPPKTIKYVWSTTVPAGTTTDSPFSSRIKIVVLHSGQNGVGQWVEDTVNLHEDFRRLFREEEVPKVRALGILSSSQNTRSRAVGDYGGFAFLSEVSR